MWRDRPDIHLLHVSEVFFLAAGDGDGDTEDADDGAKCAVVWTSVEWGAVGGCGVGVWRGGGGGVDCEKGETGKGGGEEEGEVDVMGERERSLEFVWGGNLWVQEWVCAYYKHLGADSVFGFDRLYSISDVP